jgi:hypothetical protein
LVALIWLAGTAAAATEIEGGGHRVKLHAVTLAPEDWPRAKELFARARALPASDREAYLSAACVGNDALRLEVESLLASDERAGSFLESPALVWSDGTLTQHQ